MDSENYTSAVIDTLKQEYEEYILGIHHKGKLVIGARPDGSIFFGEGYTTNDEASNIFWSNLAEAYPHLFSKRGDTA